MRMLLASLFLSLTSFLLQADEPDYVRFVEDQKGATLQTAISRLRDAAGHTVDLVGAVHIADKGYYEDLNERFKHYDAVLYELVGGPIAPKAVPPKFDLPPASKTDAKGATPKPAGMTPEERIAKLEKYFKNAEPPKSEEPQRARDPKLAWVGELHARMQKILGLESQILQINYYAPNFVHADMTADEFEAAREKKKETFLGLMFKAFVVQSELVEQGGGSTKGPGLVKLLEILCRQDNANELKRLIGREFDSMEDLMAGLESGEGTVIVTERNRIALKVMNEQFAQGRKQLAIFYGAAHLPSMEKTLKEKGFQLVKTEWLKAWDLPPASPPPTPPGNAQPAASVTPAKP